MRAKWLPTAQFVEIEATGTTAFRLASGPGTFVERFGDAALVSVTNPTDGTALVAELGQRGYPWTPGRIFSRTLVRNPGETDAPTVLRGDGRTDEIVLERGLRYEVDFAQSYSPGLFCDQRNNRNFLASRTLRRVLNLFSYTCAFSVAAAVVGSATVSVDVSKASIRRGMRNFELNGLDPAGHRFVGDDAGSVLARMVRRGEVFDAVIIDPPTFGRDRKGRAFRIVSDFGALIRDGARVLAPGGVMLLSTNYAGWTMQDLRQLALENAGRRFAFVAAEPQPDFPAGVGALSVWLVFPPDSEPRPRS